MTAPAAQTATSFDAHSIADAFVAARLAARPLPGFPGGLIPASLSQGYGVQELAIGLWPDEVAGWKVGRIPDDVQAELGADRVMGPVFRRNVWQAAPGEAIRLPVIPGGFAAVEAEYVFRMGRDTPADKFEWTAAEAVEFVDEMLAGVELAGSPLATINVLGPKVVASDFGNNAGLILGPVFPRWRERPDEVPACEAYVEGQLVGRGTTASVPGGPATSLAFLLGAAARRGRSLRAGQLVTTGAASGIHDIEAGQSARIVFGDVAEIRCEAVIASPHASGGSTDDHHNRAG